MLNDITTDKAGDLYISDTDAGKIHKYSGGQLTDWLTESQKKPCYDGVINNNPLTSTWLAWIKHRSEKKLAV